LLKKILSYGLVEGIAKGLNKLTVLALPLLIDTVSFGKIGLLISFELILPLVSLLGFERAVLRFYSERNEFLNFKKTVSVSTIVAHIFLVLVLVSIYLFGCKTFFGLSLFPDIFLVILLVYFQGSNLITINMLRVEEKHKVYFKARLFLQITKFILVFTFIYWTRSYIGYLYGAIIAAIMTNLFYRIQSDKKEAELFSKKTFLSLIVFSWPFIFHGVAGNLIGNADKFILERFMSMREVGLYTFAYSFGSMMLFAYIGISVYMEPMIYKEKDDATREILLSNYKLIALSLGVLAYIVISLLSVFILPLVYDQSYMEVITYIPVIALIFLVYPYYLQSNYRMIYNKKSLNIAITSIISATINIVFNILFIPIYGIFGAVIVTFISYLIQALMFVFISNKFKFSFEFFELLILGGIITFVIYFNIPFYFAFVPVVLFIIGKKDFFKLI
jgi:O-antigen/teichoic acid export membrane protein